MKPTFKRLTAVILTGIACAFCLAQCGCDPTDANTTVGEPALTIDPDKPLVPGSGTDIAVTEQAVADATADQDEPIDPRIEDARREAAERRAASGQPEDTGPRELVPDEDGVFDITFDDIKFEMEIGDEFKRSMLTSNVHTLHKQTIRIKGFIKPGSRQTGLKGFVFVRDDKECCFGPTAALFDCVITSLEKGTTTDFTVRPVTVEGYFYVKEYEISGQLLAIYRLRDAKVIK